MDNTEREKERSRSKQRHPFLISVESDELVYAPTAQQRPYNLHDEQGVGTENINQRRQKHQIQVKVIGEDIMWHILEHAAIIDAEMGIVVHRVGIKPQVECISLEKVMVDQRNKTIQYPCKGENRCKSNVFLPFTQGQHLHSEYLLLRLEQGDDVENHL